MNEQIYSSYTHLCVMKTIIMYNEDDDDDDDDDDIVVAGGCDGDDNGVRGVGNPL